MTSEKTAWAPGHKVGRYVLVAPLAAGGMAEIWLARQPGVHGFEKVVCIKRMTGALQDDPDHVQMFLTEARLAAGLSHRHIVQIYELGEDDGSLFIAMEFIEGESLARVARRARSLEEYVPLELAVQLVAWAAEGLHYAHTLTLPDGTPRGIIHRDVSPQNLLVTADGSVKVVDFGIAKVATDETASGKLKGKLTYMAPEQARAEPLDARADVFALGVVLFELVTGTRLFGKAAEIDILSKLISEQPLPRCSERRPDVPKELDDIVARALEPRRDERWASARALQDALERFLADHGLRVGTTDVAAYLNRLFPGRAAERHALLEAARRGESISVQQATNVFRAHTPGVSQDGDSKSSAAKSAEDPFTAPKPNRLLVPLVLVAGFGLLGLGAAAILTRKDDPPPPPVAPVQHARLTIECTPKATVLLDGQVLGVTPYVVEDLSVGEHQVVVRAPLHLEQQRTVVVKSPSDSLQLVLALEKEPPPLPPAEGPDAGAQVKVEPPPAGTAKATGKLNLRTTPWTTVYLGKRRLGDTPLVGVTLPAGSHVLKVVNREAGLDSTIEVTIRPHQTVNENLVLK